VSGKSACVARLQSKKETGEKIVVVTAYDYPFAKLADDCGVDMVLVGDSLGNVVLGYDRTIPVTMDDMLHHTRPVARAASHAMVVTDMPFGSCHISFEQSITNAIAIIKDGGADAVKIEGGSEMAPLVAEMTKFGIPVVAHIGLLPQTASLWEGYNTLGKDEASARQLVEAAQDLEEAGAVAIVLECITADVAKLITEKISIPTIGIGAGVGCDGQVLVIYDLLGLTTGKVPKFVRQYANLNQIISDAIAQYSADVRDCVFPAEENSVAMDEEEAKKLY